MRRAGVFAALLSLFSFSSASAQAAGPMFQTLPSQTFAAERANMLLIDVREPKEWAETGLPQGAIGVSISRGDFVEAVVQAAGGDRTRPVAVICRSGARSIRAAEALSRAGFAQVVNVGDGMIGRDGVGPGWIAAGLALQKSDGER